MLDLPQRTQTGTSRRASPKDPSYGDAAGINLSGYLRDESGWGAAGRGYAHALERLGVPFALNDVSALSHNRSEDSTFRHAQAHNPYDINLVCVDPSQHFALLSEMGASYFKGHYNIGAWAWELPRFPPNWFNRFAFYDEIWVTTSFVANALALVAPVPVVRIPPVLLPKKRGSRVRGRAHIRAEPGEYIFLFIFDLHSHLERKNPLALVDAFRQAFAPHEPARLVIKCVNGESDPQGLAAMRGRAAGARISIYDGYWSSDDVRDLMAACDVYVSLHRSEGTGLTITDAMALGKPVIATGWSGNMDFMTVRNSFPVRYELVEIQNGVGPYREGEIWAEPSVEHAAEMMRRVFQYRADAEACGAAAARDIQSGFSAANVANLIRERLQAVSVHRRLAVFQQDTWAAFVSYQSLVGRIVENVARLLPPDVKVLVVSKGDDRLIQIPGCRAEHFPQARSGEYAGYHPADSAAAIEHLQELQARGAEYLVLPSSSFWWLDYYADLARYLEASHGRVWDGADCIIYSLRRESPAKVRV